MSKSKIVVGAVAYDPKVVTIWEGIKEFFVSAGCEMDFVLFSNYEAQVNALMQRSIDIAWNTNLAFVCSDLQLGGKAQILAMRDTDLDFTSVIIVRRDSGISRLADLKGKTIALGSRDSAQAAVIPSYYLLQEGLVAGKDFTELRFDTDVGKHGDTGTSERNVLDAVLSGKAHAGALGQNTWNALRSSGRAADLTFIWTSPPYSHCCFTAHPELDQNKAQAFVSTLMKMDWDNPAHRVILEMEGLKKWVTGGKEGYEPVFVAAEKTGYTKKNDEVLKCR